MPNPKRKKSDPQVVQRTGLNWDYHEHFPAGTVITISVDATELLSYTVPAGGVFVGRLACEGSLE